MSLLIRYSFVACEEVLYDLFQEAAQVLAGFCFDHWQETDVDKAYLVTFIVAAIDFCPKNCIWTELC